MFGKLRVNTKLYEQDALSLGRYCQREALAKE